MENLFDTKTAQSFVARIHQLTPQTSALWGKMTVDQMLLHCQRPFEIASGKLKPKVNPIVKFLFGKSAKKQMTGAAPIKKNLPTFNEAKIADKQMFETEKQGLIASIENFQRNGPDGLIKEPHAFFGKLTVSEWNALQVNHLNHHLQQFGV